MGPLSRQSRAHGRACYEALREWAHTLGAFHERAPEPDVFLMLGHVLLAQEDRRGVIEALGQAEAGFSKSKTGADTWLHLSGLYQQAETCSGAERAAAHVPTLAAAAEILSDCARLRRWTGLPVDSQAIPVEREHEYVTCRAGARASLV